MKETHRSGASEGAACEELGISLRTLQRWRREDAPKEDQRPIVTRRPPANKLSTEEVQLALEIANSAEFRNLPPSQIVPTLADQGVYVMSESSMYRRMREAEMLQHRGRSKPRNPRPIATHCATGPNQVWVWDITWLPGPAKGLFYYLYLILDLYSRKIVGWEVWETESAEHSSALIRQAVLREGCLRSSTPLVLHSDNGSPMKAATMLETLYSLGITPSRSRPRVSNDNAYAESVFRTCKYRPEYPSSGFSSRDESRAWVKTLERWYNTAHRHSGIRFVTPHQRHEGCDAEILSARTVVYEAARTLHPERWARDTRDWTPAGPVWLNPEKPSTLDSDATQVS